MLEPLFALIFVLIREDQPQILTDEGILLAGLALCAYLLFGWQFTRQQMLRHKQAHPDIPFVEPMSLRFLNLANFMLLVMATEWVPLSSFLTYDLPFVSRLVAISPYFANAMLRGSSVFEGGLGGKRRTWKRREFLLFNLRVMLASTMPILILYGLMDLILLSPKAALWFAAYRDVVTMPSMLILLFGVFATSPLILKWLLGAKPLPEGPQRARLLAYSKRADFEPTDILVWPTGGAVTNAMFVGILPFLRYVMVTDALLNQYDQQSTDAAFAHEIGHGKRQHILLYLLMVSGWSLLLSAVLSTVFGWLPASVQSTNLLTGISIGLELLLVGVMFFVGLGWLSRRFETEADLFAARTLGGPGPIVNSLRRIGMHMGIPLDKEGFRHFGLGTRIDLITMYSEDEEFRQRFDRTLTRCRWGIMVMFGLGVLWFGLQAPNQIAHGRMRLPLLDALEKSEKGQVEQSITSLKDAVAQAAALRERTGSQGAKEVELEALGRLGDQYLALGRVPEAKSVASRLKDVSGEDELGLLNAQNLDALLLAQEGKARPELVTAVIDKLYEVDSRRPLEPNSVATAFGDLFLALRACGVADVPAPGEPAAYKGVARLIDVYERSGEYAFKDDLLDAAREDLKARWILRRLVKRIPDLPAPITDLLDGIE